MTVEDNILSPFKVEIDENNYTLMKNGVVNSKGEQTWVTVGYFTNIEGCLKRVIREKKAESKETLTLVQYLTFYQKVHNTILFAIREVMAKEFVVKKVVKYINKKPKQK